jgi:F-type H+-transporting ATPase subunit delta
VITGSLAKRYARALLELATSPEQVDRFEAQLTELARVCEQPDADGTPLVVTLAAGRYPLSRRQAVVAAVARRLGADPDLIRFLELVVERGRIAGISAIARQYRDLADARAGRVRGRVVAAQPLDPDAVARINAALARATGKHVLLETAVDPSLLGGLRTEIGSYTLDRSVVTQLEDLRAVLKTA